MAQYGLGPGTGSRMRAYVDDTGTGTGGVTPPAITDALASYAGACEIVDLSIDDSRNTAEMRRRCNDFAKAMPAKRNVLTAEFRMVFGLDATMRDQLVEDYALGIVRLWKFLSAGIADSGAVGLVLPMFVSSFPWDQPLEDVSGHDIVLTGGWMETTGAVDFDPQWVVIP